MDKKLKEKGKLCNDLLTPKNSKNHKVDRLFGLLAAEVATKVVNTKYFT